MVLIALLLVALVCLALGLIYASAYWLVGSLAASALAALLLWRVRGQVGTSAALAPAAATEVPTPATAGAAASQDSDPDAVWVIDGRPDFHLRTCARLADGEPEQIPRSQAQEDGFTPCTQCEPAAATATTAPAGDGGSATVAADEPAAGPDAQRPVWVVDGRPEYHREDCPRLQGIDSEAIPWAQATEDGFTACTRCDPDAAAAAGPAEPAEPDTAPAVAEPEPAAAAVNLAKAPDTAPAEVPAETPAAPEPAAAGASADRPVWVVDGQPQYHRQDCARLQGEETVDIPWSQATEDGFVACDGLHPGRRAGRHRAGAGRRGRRRPSPSRPSPSRS